MKQNQSSVVAEPISSQSFENDFYNRNLKGSTFQGFWYDDNEKSYGLALNFISSDKSKLVLYAQDSEFGSSLSEYLIEADDFTLDQIAYDKILFTLKGYKPELLKSISNSIQLPDSIEFTLQLLSHNSIYVQFVNHKQFSPPISKLRFGLVMAKE